MCIIAYIPQGKQIQEKTIRFMFKGNPDGAGIMWKPKDGAPIEIRKGFMKVEELIEAYYNIPQECDKAIHCRIATSGKVSTACCHPFPVRAKTNAMREAVDSASVALMHNGIITYTTPAKGMASDYSDTMLFASRILYPLQKQLNEWHIQTLIENSTTSRLLIFRQDGEPLVLGDWKFEDGIYYSNGNYKASVYGNGYGYGGCYGYGSWLDKHDWNATTKKWEPKTSTSTEKPKSETKASQAVIELTPEEDDIEDQLDGYNNDDMWEYYITIPEEDTRTNMEIENDILEAFDELGHDVLDLYTEDYISQGIAGRSVYALICGQLSPDVETIAGFALE